MFPTPNALNLDENSNPEYKITEIQSRKLKKSNPLWEAKDGGGGGEGVPVGGSGCLESSNCRSGSW